jgi:hypothetical protein
MYRWKDDNKISLTKHCMKLWTEFSFPIVGSHVELFFGAEYLDHLKDYECIIKGFVTWNDLVQFTRKKIQIVVK